jgi:hypothetical protein
LIEDPTTEQLILLASTRKRTRGPVKSPADTDGLFGPELLARQVDLDTGGESVPPVVAASGTADMNFCDHQVAAQQIVKNESSDVTMPPRRVAGMPVGEIIRRARVDTPAGTHGPLDIHQRPGNHGADDVISR